MTELRVGGWSSAVWGKRSYGINFEAATDILRGSAHTVGSVQLAPTRYGGLRWLQWEVAAEAIVVQEIWAGGEGLVDHAVCIKLGDDKSGDIKAVSVCDASSADMSGPVGALISVLLEDGSIALLKIRSNTHSESVLRNLVQFKEGELIDLRSDSYAAAHAPLRQYWFQLSNMPPAGILSTGTWLPGSALDLTVTFGEGVNYCLYARLILQKSTGSKFGFGGNDGDSDVEVDAYSIDEWVLRSQTPFLEIISGWLGARESPQVLATGGLCKAVNRFDKDRSVVASISVDGTVVLWDAEARRPLFQAPSPVRAIGSGWEAVYGTVEEARVSVISGDSHYDILVAASTCRGRLLEWRVALIRVYLTQDRTSGRELTHDVLYLSPPAQLFSVYATLIDVCCSTNGRTVYTMWRDGLKEKEYLITHEIPNLTQSRQWSNWMADPLHHDADASLRCVARELPCSTALTSSEYAMGVLDGLGLDGRLCATLDMQSQPTRVKNQLAKRLCGAVTGGLMGLLKNSNLSASKMVETIHAVMLKRIFSPGTFTGTVIRSVLLRDVPESVRLSDSAALRQAAEEISLSPHVLGGFVAEVCILWAQLTVVSGDAMDLDSSSFVAASDNSVDFVTASRLETAYFNFFKLCAKKSFEFYFSRRGSLSFNVGPGGNVLVSVSRRGGVLGLLCDVPNASSRSVLEADDLTCNDGTKLCASKLYIAFRKQIQNQGIESRIGLDGIAARLAVFLEHSHDYAPHSARAWISEAFIQQASHLSSLALRDVFPLVAACLSDTPCDVLEKLLDVHTKHRADATSASDHPSIAVVGSLMLDALSLTLKSTYEYLTTVCLILACIVSSPVMPSLLPPGVIGAVSLVYFPRAIAELLRIGFLLWSSSALLDEPVSLHSTLGRVDVADLMPRIAVSSFLLLTNSRLADSISKTCVLNSSVHGLMSALLRTVPGGQIDLYSSQFWDQFGSLCLHSLFQMSTPHSTFMGALIDSKNYGLVARAASLCRLFSDQRRIERQFNVRTAMVPSGLATPVHANVPSIRSKLIETISEVQTNMFAIQSLIMKELRTLLVLAASGACTESKVMRILQLVEDLFQCSDFRLDSFAVGGDANSAISNSVEFASVDDLLSQGGPVGGEAFAEIGAWLLQAISQGHCDVASIVNFAETLYTLMRLPTMQLWLRNIHDERGNFSRLDLLVDRHPTILAAFFMMHCKAVIMSFIERFRWLLVDTKTRSVLALKVSSSCLEGIEAVSEAFSSDSIVGDRVGKLLTATMTLVRADLIETLRGSFAYAIEGEFFDEALSFILRLRNQIGSQRSVSSGQNEGAVSSAHKQIWETCLCSLICSVCETGHLGWLCSVPNMFIGQTNLSEAILMELESLACSTEIDAFLTSSSIDTRTLYCSNYYECLAAFQLSRFDYHGAARALNSLVTELDSKTQADFGLQSSLLSAASQSLQMLPLAEQFIIQRSPVMIASFTSEPSARNAVDVQSMISLSSVPSLNGRADSAFGMAKLTEGDVGGVTKIPANTSDIIRALCEHLMFNEALNIAFQSTTLTCAGAGVDGLEPLSAAMSSVSLNADSGMGLFVHFLTTFCCKAGSTDSTVCTGLKGHVVSPLSNWNYNAIIFDCGYAKSNNLWYYLADILRVFDGPQMGNWGLHRIAVLACIAARPGRKLPENLVRSFCSDLLIPTNGEKRQGNGMGLLRLLYEHGHILEACNLASRIINDFIDPRNKLAHSNNTQKVPQIPFTFLDELIFAIDRILKAAGNSASNSSKTRAIVCAALTDSQASLKRAIEIMIKVNLINSYN